LVELALQYAKKSAHISDKQFDLGRLQMDFNKDWSKDHSMIVTYRSPQGVPYVTYHSTNTYDRSVASIIASYPNAAYYAYRT
jgi:Putative amidase domain